MNSSLASGGLIHRRLRFAGGWLRRHPLVMAGAVAAAIGLAFGWNWLYAIGVLPFLFAMLPCLLMLGMCMRGMGGGNNSESANATQPTTEGDTTPRVSPRQITLQLEEHSNA